MRSDGALGDGATKTIEQEFLTKLVKIEHSALSSCSHLDLIILGVEDTKCLELALSVTVELRVVGDVVTEAVVEFCVIRASVTVTVSISLTDSL